MPIYSHNSITLCQRENRLKDAFDIARQAKREAFRSSKQAENSGSHRSKKVANVKHKLCKGKTVSSVQVFLVHEVLDKPQAAYEQNVIPLPMVQLNNHLELAQGVKWVSTATIYLASNHAQPNEPPAFCWLLDTYSFEITLLRKIEVIAESTAYKSRPQNLLAFGSITQGPMCSSG